MSSAGVVPAPRLTDVAPRAAEQAVALDEQRIATELVDTVIRDLFAVGLTLHSALALVSGPAEQPLTSAIDEIDSVIRRIRDVVFDLERRHSAGLG